MPSRCLTTTLPVVTRLLIRSPSSTRFCSRKVRSWVGGDAAGVDQRRRSGSAPASTLLNAWSCAAKLRIADSRVDLAVQHGVAVADQRRRDVEVVVGGLDEGVAGVDDPLQVLAGAVEGRAELVDGGLEVLLVDRLDRLGEVGQQRVGGDREPGVLLVDHRAVVRGRGRRCAAAAGRRTAHRPRSGCRPRRGCRRGSRRSPCRCRGRRRRPRRSARACRPVPTLTPR